MATLNENIDRIENAKIAIKDAIVAKGVAVDDTALIDTYASKIEAIPTGGASGPIRMADHPEMRLGNSKFTAFTNEDFDFSGVIKGNSMFENCAQLISIPEGIDFSLIDNAYNMFAYCSKLSSLPEGLNFSKVKNGWYMFASDISLKTIPLLVFNSLEEVNGMFSGCDILLSLPKLNFDKVKSIGSIFGWQELPNLTDLGGFTGLKIDWNDEGGLFRLPNLTKQSVLNVINELYDFRANGDDITTKTIKFHPNSLALLSEEEKAIATNKGWNLVS